MTSPCYLDTNGSAPLSPAVENYYKNRLETHGPYANPNANHYLGARCMMNIEKARRQVASLINCESSEIIFNSGSSEGISQVFHHLIIEKVKNQTAKNHIVISELEHSAVKQSANHLESLGFTVHRVSVTEQGEINFSELSQIVQENAEHIALVSIMAANNETGVIQPYKEIAELCQQHEILFFSDTTQIIGKEEFNFADSGMSIACMSAHKIGGPTGVGALIVRKGLKISPMIFGGNQEKGIRGGTQNYFGIEGFGVACQETKEKLIKLEELRFKRDKFEEKLLERFPGTVIFGKDVNRVANTSYISVPRVLNTDLQFHLQAKKIYVTTGSACSDQSKSISPILKAMNVSIPIGHGATRLSFSVGLLYSNWDELEETIFSCIQSSVKKETEYSPLNKFL